MRFDEWYEAVNGKRPSNKTTKELLDDIMTIEAQLVKANLLYSATTAWDSERGAAHMAWIESAKEYFSEPTN